MTTTNIKPFKLWGHFGPNPLKVAILLRELNIPYETISVPITDMKKPDYTAVNPNGRVPSIYDPNTDITLWESGAIIEYLIERYDTEQRLSFPSGTTESYHAKQWLFFQATGQGPYYGQMVWFYKFHHERLESAVERYSKEFNRVNGVLEGVLEKNQQQRKGDAAWLVGDKLSFVDLAFLPWQLTPEFAGVEDVAPLEEFPRVREWMGRMEEREEVRAAMEEFGLKR